MWWGMQGTLNLRGLSNHRATLRCSVLESCTSPLRGHPRRQKNRTVLRSKTGQDFSGLNRVPSNSLKSSRTVPQNMTVFGGKVFKEVIKWSIFSWAFLCISHYISLPRCDAVVPPCAITSTPKQKRTLENILPFFLTTNRNSLSSHCG